MGAVGGVSAVAVASPYVGVSAAAVSSPYVGAPLPADDPSSLAFFSAIFCLAVSTCPLSLSRASSIFSRVFGSLAIVFALSRSSLPCGDLASWLSLFMRDMPLKLPRAVLLDAPS